MRPAPATIPPPGSSRRWQSPAPARPERRALRCPSDPTRFIKGGTSFAATNMTGVPGSAGPCQGRVPRERKWLPVRLVKGRQQDGQNHDGEVFHQGDADHHVPCGERNSPRSASRRESTMVLATETIAPTAIPWVTYSSPSTVPRPGPDRSRAVFPAARQISPPTSPAEAR